MNINHNFQNVADSYLFSTIAKKVAEYQQENPKADIIRLGTKGMVTSPIPSRIISALGFSCWYSATFLAMVENR